LERNSGQNSPKWIWRENCSHSGEPHCDDCKKSKSLTYIEQVQSLDFKKEGEEKPGNGLEKCFTLCDQPSKILSTSIKSSIGDTNERLESKKTSDGIQSKETGRSLKIVSRLKPRTMKKILDIRRQKISIRSRQIESDFIFSQDVKQLTVLIIVAIFLFRMSNMKLLSLGRQEGLGNNLLNEISKSVVDLLGQHQVG
jgi:hypothetical protein